MNKALQVVLNISILGGLLLISIIFKRGDETSFN